MIDDAQRFDIVNRLNARWRWRGKDENKYVMHVGRFKRMWARVKSLKRVGELSDDPSLHVEAPYDQLKTRIEKINPDSSPRPLDGSGQIELVTKAAADARCCLCLRSLRHKTRLARWFRPGARSTIS